MNSLEPTAQGIYIDIYIYIHISTYVTISQLGMWRSLGIPRGYRGIPMGILHGGSPWGFRGMPWHVVACHMACHGKPWHAKACQGMRLKLYTRKAEMQPSKLSRDQKARVQDESKPARPIYMQVCFTTTKKLSRNGCQRLARQKHRPE